MPRKKPVNPAPPVRTIAELLAESRRLEQRAGELLEQAKALASEVAEAKAKSKDRRGGRRPE